MDDHVGLWGNRLLLAQKNISKRNYGVSYLPGVEHGGELGGVGQVALDHAVGGAPERLC